MRTKWIHSPVVDMIVGCGAWSLPLLFLAHPFTGGDLPAWSVVFYTLALAFNYPHYMATVYRAYHTKEDFVRYRVFTVHITALLLFTLIAAHWATRLIPWLFTIYITWSPWHYMGQNFGLTMMFIQRNGIRIDKKDRNALWAAFVASYMMLFLAFHTNPSSDPYAISIGLPSLLDVFRVPALAIFLILGIWPLSKLVRQAGWRPMAGPIVLYITEFLWFVLPTVLELTMGVQLPQTRYSTGIMAVMHSAQYLWITSYFAKHEGDAGNWNWKRYSAILGIGGIALFVPGPWLMSYVFHRDFTSSFLIFTALVNIHHFILDGAVWKLRERRVKSLLVEPEREAQPAVTGWELPVQRPWRLAGAAAAAVLLLLAVADQSRYYLGVHRTESSLRRSLQMNPYDFRTQNALARILVDTQRYDEAYYHYRQMFGRVDPDAASLMNFGVLCQVLDKNDEATASFDRALQKNPSYANAIRRLQGLP